MKKTLFVALTLLASAAVAQLYAADARENWTKHCAKCHGEDGKGDTKMGKKLEVKDMTSADYQTKLTDAAAFKATKEGIKDGDKVKMKPAEGLSDDEIKGLVTLVRSFKK